MKCKNCNIKIEKVTNKKFCSPKCREHVRYLKRKDNSNYRIRQKIRSQKYELKTKKQIKLNKNESNNKRLRDMQALAKSRGGKCLSDKYINSHTKSAWECKEKHIWRALFSSIKDGSWCPYCAKVKKRTIEEMRELAISRGGKCLSKTYTNMLTKLEWECENQHIWFALPHSVIGGSWCPICSQGISERICRSFFEKIFNAKFHIGKYKWLLSPKNANMQLDGYNKKLKLAFEYQGIQHYKLNGIRFNKKDLDYQQQCDQIKRDTCKLKDITLIEVPYTIKYEDMEKFIIDKYYKLTGINIPFKNINYKEFNVYSIDKIKEMQDIAKSHGGECLSKIYINNYTSLKWRCGIKHIWYTTAHHIRRGSWCPTCARIKPKDL
jgi:hypothetical protein